MLDTVYAIIFANSYFHWFWPGAVILRALTVAMLLRVSLHIFRHHVEVEIFARVSLAKFAKVKPPRKSSARTVVYFLEGHNDKL